MPVTLGSPLRAFLGLLLLAAAGVVIVVTHDLEFGIGWTAVIPALALGLPGAALLKRRVIARVGDRLCITDGWWWRRAYEDRLVEARLEQVPTAGLWAVVLHQGGRTIPIATWVRAATAHRIAAALALPMTQAAPPAADR